MPALRLRTSSRRLILLWFALGLATATARAAAPVTVAETAEQFTLDNGLLTARVDKRTGTLTSLRYEGLELLAQRGSGANGGYWSSVGGARVGSGRRATVRQSPATNGGGRAEISIRLFADDGGRPAPVEIDLRYALGRGEHWLYAGALWRHEPGWPPLGAGEARYCIKLNPQVFDFMTIDAGRRRVMPSGEDWDRGEPLNLKEARRMTTGLHKGEPEHKYGYSAVLEKTRAYGWSSTRHGVGLWIVNPSMEYIAGGPTKMELTGHLDVNPGGSPTLLNMWLGSHYGGSSLAVAPEEDWSKLIGPFLIYCNQAAPTPDRAAQDASDPEAGAPHEALWKDALARAATEAARWPYDWVADTNYPAAAQRATVTGQLVIRDPLAPPGLRVSNLWVGLTLPNYTNPPMRLMRGLGGTNAPGSFPGGGPFTNRAERGPAGGVGRGGFPPHVDWQRDAKFYQFWTRADAEGRFTIRNVRPGAWTLRAIADGVLGEFALDGVRAPSGETHALGVLTWTPRRHGRELWQIGVADRTAREFRHGTNAWRWGTYLHYTNDFPDDVNFLIGQNDWPRDWNYVQPPRVLGPPPRVAGEENDDEPGPPGPTGGRGVQSTMWRIVFDLPVALRGRATLRLAFCGTHAGCNVEAFVNDASIGETGPLPSTSAMQRDGAQAYWIEKPLAFDAARLKAGTNVLGLLSHAGSWAQGVMYDCVRLELDPHAPPP